MVQLVWLAKKAQRASVAVRAPLELQERQESKWEHSLKIFKSSMHAHIGFSGRLGSQRNPRNTGRIGIRKSCG